MSQIKIFDTTLRDGEQAPGCSMNLKEKLVVARCLEHLNVDIIEAGFAMASPGDFESVQAIARTVQNASVASLARARTEDIDCAWEAIREAADPRLHLFIATSPLHMASKLKLTPEEVLERTAAMVSYARKYTSNIEFSCEDATRSDVDFLIRVVDVAVRNGAMVINLPDTTGYTTPDEMCCLIKAIRGPINHIRLLAVGGVNEKNIGEFIKAGVNGAGVGGNLVNKEWIKNGEFDKITALAEEFCRNAQ